MDRRWTGGGVQMDRSWTGGGIHLASISPVFRIPGHIPRFSHSRFFDIPGFSTSPIFRHPRFFAFPIFRHPRFFDIPDFSTSPIFRQAFVDSSTTTCTDRPPSQLRNKQLLLLLNKATFVIITECLLPHPCCLWWQSAECGHV